MRHITVCTHLRTLDSATLGGPLKQWNQQQNAQNVRNMALNILPRTLVYFMRAETRKQSMAPLDISWERVHQDKQIFHCSEHICQWLRKHLKHWWWGLQQGSQQENSQTQNPQITRSTLFPCNKTFFSFKREYHHGIFQMVILRHFPNLHKISVNTGKEALKKRRY